VVEEGNVTFEVGGEAIEATAGDIAIAPAGVPHKFINAGGERSRHVDIHPSARMNGDTMAIGKGPSAVRVIERKDLSHSASACRFEGEESGEIPVSFFWADTLPGMGTGLHCHPYSEVFVVLEGAVILTVGDETLEATAGQIAIAPAEVPHRFVNGGTALSRHLDIHPSPRVITRWLEK
jgi:quercetin dioxygenase-like cupin family protein